MLNIKRDSNIFIYVVIAALFSLFLLIYFPTLSVLHVSWSEMNRAYAHGYVVLGLTFYLLYISRNKIFLLNQSVTSQYFSIYLAAILLSSILWFLASSIQVQVIQLFTVILMVWLWLAVVFGKSSSIHALMTIGLLLTAMPLWEGLVFYLQSMTIFVTQLCLSSFGIIAFVDGYFIYLVDGMIEVAEECSGLKYFLAGLSLSIVYAELNINTIQRKIGIVLLAVIIAIMANWIRVISLVLIADFSKMQSSMLYKHDNLGWVVFIFCFAIFFIIAHKIDPGRKIDRERDQAQLPSDSTSRLIGNYYFRAFSATLAASILPVFSWFVTVAPGTDLLSHQLQFEMAKKIDKPVWVPNYAGYDEINTWRVTVDAREVDITIMSYRDQKQGRELIYYSNKLNSSSYKLKNIDGLEVAEGLSINRSVLSDQSGKLLVGWYYKVGNFESINSNMAKLLQIPSIMQGIPVASLVTISMRCESSNCEMEKEQLLSRELIEDIINSIEIYEGAEDKL